VWGPASPMWKGEERISSNLGMAKLGGRSLERGKTAAALSKIRREREASVAGGGGTGAKAVGTERGR
jgi:hypothetical protein